MLGRSIGITDDQLRHLADEHRPRVSIASRIRSSSGMRAPWRNVSPSTTPFYDQLVQQFSEQQIMDVCLLVGAQTVIYFFNKTFLADVDEEFVRANEEADHAAGGRPVVYPPLPH
jgi:hypothetical protein